MSFAERSQKPPLVGAAFSVRVRRAFFVILATIGAGIRAVLAGMRASKEYRHLNGMSDRRLKMLGLSRSHILQEVHRRHLKPLGGRFANTDLGHAAAKQ